MRGREIVKEFKNNTTFIFQIRHLTDLHSVHRSSLTALFAHSTLDPKSVEVPGPKSKHKKGTAIQTTKYQNIGFTFGNNIIPEIFYCEFPFRLQAV